MGEGAWGSGGSILRLGFHGLKRAPTPNNCNEVSFTRTLQELVCDNMFEILNVCIQGNKYVFGRGRDWPFR